MYEQYFDEMDEYKEIYTEFAKLGSKSIFDRIDLLRLCFSTVERCASLWTTHYAMQQSKQDDGTDIDLEDWIKYDYKTSTYANYFYTVWQGLFSEYLKLFARIHNERRTVYDSEIHEKHINKIRAGAKRCLAVSARYSIQRFIEYYELEKQRRAQKLPKRLPLLKEAFWCADRLLATKLEIEFEDGIQPKTMIFSVQPNSGKSFLSNVFSLQGIITHKIFYNTSGVIRMTNTGNNAEGFSGQCKNMISDGKIMEVYPELKKYFVVMQGFAKCQIFKKEPLEEWLLKDLDSSIRASMFAVGREKAINGMRNDVALVIDDLSDGKEQMNNDQAHKEMVAKYDVDIKSRREDKSVPTLIVGTMFNEFDLQNSIIERTTVSQGEFTRFDIKNFRNTYVSPNKDVVVVLVDCFDENGESLAPKLISTEELLEAQNNMASYQFDLVYRQKRTSREPRTFDYDTLLTYNNENTADLNDHSICILDPTRVRASDYFVLSAYKLNKLNNKYRFFDCICEQKSLGTVSDPKNVFAHKMADFLIENNCTHLYLENNTSNTLGTLITALLEQKGYSSCKIEEIFSVKDKKTRILDMETTIKNNIEFPQKNLYPLRHPITIAMNLLTRFDSNNVGRKGNFDDVADNVALFAKKFLYNQKIKARIVGKAKPILF